MHKVSWPGKDVEQKSSSDREVSGSTPGRDLIVLVKLVPKMKRLSTTVVDQLSTDFYFQIDLTQQLLIGSEVQRSVLTSFFTRA